MNLNEMKTAESERGTLLDKIDVLISTKKPLVRELKKQLIEKNNDWINLIIKDFTLFFESIEFQVTKDTLTSTISTCMPTEHFVTYTASYRSIKIEMKYSNKNISNFNTFSECCFHFCLHFSHPSQSLKSDYNIELRPEYRMYEIPEKTKDFSTVNSEQIILGIKMLEQEIAFLTGKLSSVSNEEWFLWLSPHKIHNSKDPIRYEQFSSMQEILQFLFNTSN